MTNMVAFAWREADSKTETFKRWFDEADADNVKKVLEKVVSSQGVQQPTVLMKDWICEQNDVKGACRPTTNAYSVSNKGQFHLCPPGVAQPNAADLKCSDLDGFPSAKMKSVAFTMLHEVTHWTKVGDDALGKHITDKANGASDCINLSPADKLINAQNYAFLGAVSCRPFSLIKSYLTNGYRKPTSKSSSALSPIHRLEPEGRTTRQTTSASIQVLTLQAGAASM